MTTLTNSRTANSLLAKLVTIQCISRLIPVISRLYLVLVDYSCVQILVHVHSLIFEVLSTFTTYSRHNPSKLRIATMLHVLAIHAQLNKLDFISISLPLLHNPLMEFITWLGRISSGPTWTGPPIDLFDPHMIYENLLYHRSNDLDFVVACLVPICPRGKTEHLSAKPS